MIIERVLSSYQSQVMCKKKYDERESWSSFVHTWKTTAFCSVFDVFSLFALQREFRSYILENDNSRLILSATASLCMYSHKERLLLEIQFQVYFRSRLSLMGLVSTGWCTLRILQPTLSASERQRENVPLFFHVTYCQPYVTWQWLRTQES